jgi:hypothetical protein
VTAVLAAQLVSDAAFGRRVLREVAGDEAVPASVRVSAARFMISFGHEYAIARDTEERLAALEEQLGLDAASRYQQQKERRSLRAAR